MNTKVEDMVGKTIKSITKQAVNCWRFDFTDGTQKFIWAEAQGPLGIGHLFASDTE